MRNFEPKWWYSWSAYQNYKETISARGLALCTRHCPIVAICIPWIFRQAAHPRTGKKLNITSTYLRSFWSGKNSFGNYLFDVIIVKKSCFTSPRHRRIFWVTFLSAYNTCIRVSNEVQRSYWHLTCFKCNFTAILDLG